MIKLTFPIVKSIILKNKLAVLGLIVISILLGIAPTLKSELESGLIQLIDEAIGGMDVNLSTPFEINQTSEPDLPQRIAYALFGKNRVVLGIAFIYYLIITVFTLVITVIARSIQAEIIRRVFSALMRRRIEKSTGCRSW